MRVLIADDQKDVGKSLADLVRYCNHDVVAVVGSGLEAINAYTLYHPDLVLMDYRMPKLNGGTACRHIIAKDPAARVILVTAWSPSDDTSVSGAIAILPKPVALERLDATLQTVAQMLPALSPAEMPFPEVCYQPVPIDYFQPVAEPSPIVPPPIEMPIPEISYQPVLIDYFQPIAEPLPIVPPSLETTFPVDAPQNQFEQTVEAPALVEVAVVAGVPAANQKKTRSNGRRTQRARARGNCD
ncbi:MAG TPA: response regulator transcription factor [Chthoniobacterales bacterium]|nr:response regulator transcription factor [Chthoniobacterales bacterium]